MEFEKVREFIVEKLQRELPAVYRYHSFAHVMDVYAAAEELAALEGLSDYETSLLRTAVLYHDCGFTEQSQNHELIGCRIARETLPNFNYSAAELDTICAMIMATKIPQNPHNLMEKIICDADLDYLGRDDFWEIGNKLYQELLSLGAIESELEWNRLQVRFLQQHEYFTDSAKRLRAAKKEEHLQKLISIIN